MRHRISFVACMAAVTTAISTPAPAAGMVGREFPDFRATDAMHGGEFALSELRGCVVLVDFWATWCAPCRVEMPNVKRIYDSYHEQGFEIVGVSLDSSESRFRSFVLRSDMPWLHVMEGGGWKTRLVREYGVRSIPRMFLIGADGTCLAEGNRIGRMEATIRDALADIGPLVDAPAEPLDPAAVAEQARVEALCDTLREAIGPLHTLELRLGRVDLSRAAIERELASGADDALLKRRYGYLRRQFGEVRRELFLMGLLDEAVSMPADLFGDGAEADRMAMPGELDVARTSSAALKDILVGARGELEELVARLSQRAGSTDPADLESCAIAVLDLLSNDHGQAVDRILDRLETRRVALELVAGALAVGRQRIESLRGLQEAADDPARLESLRAGYAELLTGIADASVRIAALGAGPGRVSERAGSLPGDDDEISLVKAAATLDSLETVLASERGLIDGLATEAQRLRGAGGAGRAGGNRPVDPRLADLSGRVLALDDRPPLRSS